MSHRASEAGGILALPRSFSPMRRLLGFSCLVFVIAFSPFAPDDKAGAEAEAVAAEAAAVAATKVATKVHL